MDKPVTTSGREKKKVEEKEPSRRTAYGSASRRPRAPWRYQRQTCRPLEWNLGGAKMRWPPMGGRANTTAEAFGLRRTVLASLPLRMECSVALLGRELDAKPLRSHVAGTSSSSPAPAVHGVSRVCVYGRWTGPRMALGQRGPMRRRSEPRVSVVSQWKAATSSRGASGVSEDL